MKILIGSDFHGYDKAYLDFSILLQKDYDIGIIAGDLATYTDDLMKQEYFLKQLITSTTGKPVYFIMGNDDGLLYNNSWTSYYNFHNIHNQTVRCNGYDLIGYQYTPMFMGGKFEKSELEIANDLSKIKLKDPKKTIFISHCPPLGVLDLSVDSNHFGSQAIKDFVDEKNFMYHIFGHIHNAYGYEGRSINAAYPSFRKYIGLDTENGMIQEVELEY